MSLDSAEKSSILLLSVDQIIETILGINIDAYLKQKVTTVGKVPDLKQKIKEGLETDKNKKFVILIDFRFAPYSIDTVKQGLENYSEAIELVITNELGDIFPDKTQFLPSFLELKPVVKALAAHLSITAKEMTTATIELYAPIAGKVLRELDTIPCELFVKKAGKFFVMEPESPSELTEDEYFVKVIDRLELIEKVTGKLVQKISDFDEQAQATAMNVAEMAVEAIGQKLSTDPAVTKEIVNISQNCTTEIEQVMGKSSNLSDLLKTLTEDKSHYLYLHSVLATYIAQKMLEGSEWFSIEHLKKVTFCYFFQDVFLVPLYAGKTDWIPETELFTSANISEKDRDLLAKHARMASEAIVEFPDAPIGVEMLTVQHHGSPNGHGIVPNPRDNISPISKVMLVAERFVELSFRSLTNGTFNRDLKFEYADQLKQTMSMDSYKNLAEQIKHIPL